jgi:transcriptional regulator with XRE-family HTH domain
MDNGHEIRDFLTSRRARITPEQAGLPAYGGNRRVAGLRREEVALLAGVSIDYYTRLERGRAPGASESVLEGIARALQLDEAERAHLFDLTRASAAPAAPQTPRRAAPQQVRPSVRRILDSMTATPAYVRNARLDILAANRLGAALFAPVLGSPAQPANNARFLFLDPAAREFYPDWERQAKTW